MSTTGNLENKPLTLSEMRDFIGNISDHARGGNTLKATKTGAMVSVDDAYAGHLLGLTVYGNSVQDGTPTPESPVPIKSVAGINVITGKHPNLWGGEVMRDSILNAIPNSASRGTNSDSDGDYVWFTAPANANEFVKYIFKENTPYTFIYKIRKSSGTASNMQAVYTDGTVDLISGANELMVTQTLVFTSNPNKTLLSIVKRNGSGTSCLYYNECGLFEGTLTAADFVPYVGSSTPLTLIDDQGVAHELCSLPGGIRNELIVNADGSGTLVEQSVCKPISDTASWNKAGNGEWYRGFAMIDSLSANSNVPSLCSHFVQRTTAELVNNTYRLRVNTQGINVVLYIYSDAFSEITTKQELVDWLNANNVTFLRMINPTTYHIPAINMPSLPDLVSNAWISATDADGAAIACECAIEYRRDINKVIGDIEEAIADIVSQ